jgi:septum site-determining protein MinD
MAGTVLAVASGKGGVGKTTTAINLAVALGTSETPAVVLDADLGMPNVGAFLGIDPEVTLHDVLAGESEIDAAIVESDAGVDVVPGSPGLEDFADADPDALDSVLESLRERYRHVVVDTGGGLSYEAVSPIELADSVVLVTTPLPAAIADAERTTQVADRLGVPVAGVVVTRANEDTDPESIAAELDVELLGRVAFDPRVRESAADGTPIVAAAPDSQPASAYRRIASTLTGDRHGKSDAGSESNNEDTDGAESETEPEDASATQDPGSGVDDGDEDDSDEDGDDGDEDDGAEEGPNGADEESRGEESVVDNASADDPEDSRDRAGSTPPESADKPSTSDGSDSKPGLFGRLFGWLR